MVECLTTESAIEALTLCRLCSEADIHSIVSLVLRTASSEEGRVTKCNHTQPLMSCAAVWCIRGRNVNTNTPRHRHREGAARAAGPSLDAGVLEACNDTSHREGVVEGVVHSQRRASFSPVVT